MIRVRLITASVAAAAIAPVAMRWSAPALAQHGVELLFLLSAFLLRLLDRRRAPRPDLTSHIRLQPARLLIWIAALIAGGWPAGVAALFAELILYPLTRAPLTRINRIGLATLLIAGGAVLEGLTRVGWGFDLLRYLTLYVSGLMLAAFWLRGPDGDPAATLIASGGVILYGAIGWALPSSLSWSLPAASACLLLTLAHGTTLRRAPLHWRGHGAFSFRRLRPAPASPPF